MSDVQNAFNLAVRWILIETRLLLSSVLWLVCVFPTVFRTDTYFEHVHGRYLSILCTCVFIIYAFWSQSDHVEPVLDATPGLTRPRTVGNDKISSERLAQMWNRSLLL